MSKKICSHGQETQDLDERWPIGADNIRSFLAYYGTFRAI